MVGVAVAPAPGGVAKLEGPYTPGSVLLPTPRMIRTMSEPDLPASQGSLAYNMGAPPRSPPFPPFSPLTPLFSHGQVIPLNLLHC